MTKRKVMIHMLTSRLELGASLFDTDDADLEQGDEDAEREFSLSELLGELPEPTEMLMEGCLATDATRVELIYEESDLTGMDGSVTTIGFDRANPSMVSMLRTGTVRTALTFEDNKRHICIYHTPFSDFEVCVRTLCVKNELLKEGKLFLDYLVEIHGAQAEHCKMTVTLHSIE